MLRWLAKTTFFNNIKKFYQPETFEYMFISDILFFFNFFFFYKY